MQERFRKSYITLPILKMKSGFAPLASITGTHGAKIVEVELCLSDAGEVSAAGQATTVQLEINGQQQLGAGLSVPGSAGGLGVGAVSAVQELGGNYPGGVLWDAGDVLTLLVTALPNVPPAGGFVKLALIQVDN